MRSKYWNQEVTRLAQPPPLEPGPDSWVSLFLQSVVYLFAGWADWKFLGVAARNPLLAAERTNRFSAHHSFGDLLFADVVRKALMVSRIGGR